MRYIESTMETGEELIYKTTLPSGFLRLVILLISGIVLMVLALMVPIGFALSTGRLGRFPIIWGNSDSLAVLLISIFLWVIPLAAVLFFSTECAQIFACELAVTDRRVIGRIPSARIFRTVEIPLADINQITLKNNQISFKLKDGRVEKISHFQNAWQFVETCRVRLMVTQSLVQPPEDPTQRLKRLKEALDSGLITDLEYSDKKNEILKQM